MTPCSKTCFGSCTWLQHMNPKYTRAFQNLVWKYPLTLSLSLSFSLPLRLFFSCIHLSLSNWLQLLLPSANGYSCCSLLHACCSLSKWLQLLLPAPCMLLTQPHAAINPRLLGFNMLPANKTSAAQNTAKTVQRTPQKPENQKTDFWWFLTARNKTFTRNPCKNGAKTGSEMRFWNKGGNRTGGQTTFVERRKGKRKVPTPKTKTRLP